MINLSQYKHISIESYWFYTFFHPGLRSIVAVIFITSAFNAFFCYFKPCLLFCQAVFQVLYLCLPLSFTATTGRPLKALALLLTHVLCKHAICSLNKISLCLTDRTTLACNSTRSGKYSKERRTETTVKLVLGEAVE